MNLLPKARIWRESVLDCGSPLPLSISHERIQKRQWAAAVQDLAAFRAVIVLLALALAPVLQAQPNLPHLAYAYPAGGQQGATVQVTVGGQFLGAISNACISGTGFEVALVEYNRPMNPKEFNTLRQQLNELLNKRQAARRPVSPTNTWTVADQKRLIEIRDKILKNPPIRRTNPAMAETALLSINIGTNAEFGEHEIRLQTSNALSNPLNFYVGQLAEFSESPAKPANPDVAPLLARLSGRPAASTPASKPEIRLTLPCVINGQIMPGGVNRYRIAARQGQQLIISVAARALIPYLADAVPGWFEAVVTLQDDKGAELAHAERFRFRPDPVIHFEVPRDGEYVVVIRDSIYRGREDFVYRMTIGELPFVTDIFPLGGPVGASTLVELKGWNLPTNRLTLDNLGKEPNLCPVTVRKDGKTSNPVPFAVDTLPECREQEPNNSPESAQPITLPVIINGRIDAPGDADVCRFAGHAGEQIVAEVMARRLGSPLDSTLTLTDAAGKRLAFNDDFEDKGSGLETHHADSYLAATLPADGVYFVQIADAQQQGGPDYAYRLRLSAPRPDFALRVVPSSLRLRAGMSVPATVYALRKDGFTNAIDLRLQDAPAGFSLSGGRIPANEDKAQFTLKAPARPPLEPLNLTLAGHAEIGGKTLTHAAVPAEDMMQAFAYRHLVPAEELKVLVIGNPRPFLAASSFRIVGPLPLKIPTGGIARVRVTTPTDAFSQRFDLELGGAPEGLAIQATAPTTNGIEITLSCEAEKPKPGATGNLIVNVLAKNPPRPRAPNLANRPRVPVAALPAIPFEIVSQ